MSDYDFPELPSDEELGITDEDREKYADQVGDDSPEMSEAELAALLGPVTARGGSPGAASGASDQKPDRAEAKEARKKDKAARAEARRAEKERKKQEKAARKAARAAKAGAKAGGGAAAAPVATAGETSGSASSSGGGAAPPSGPPTAEAAAASGGRWKGPLTLVALIAVAAFASSRTGIPAPAPANTPDSLFSSSRAMTTLVDMVRRAHPTGSPEHAWVRDFIVGELTELGLSPEIQTTTSLVQSGQRARAATVRNIVARLPGTAPTGGVLVTAHYDSREISAGAADDGSGVVTILEAIRAIRTGGPLRNDLIVVITDAEELGLMGARAFVDEHPLMADVDVVLSFEMRGGGGPSIMFETADQNGWIVRTMKEWDAHPFANSMSYEVYQRMPNATDFTPFVEAGAQGLNFAAIDNAHVYHQVFDTPDNLSEATLQHHGLHALGAMRYYGDADLTEVNSGNVVYFSLPGLGLFVYRQLWVLPISAALIALLALVVVVARRFGAGPLGMGIGVGLSLLTGAAAWGLGYGLMYWLPGIHGEDGMLHGSVFHHEGWYVLALAFGTLAVLTLLLPLVRRWASVVELSIGALVVPAGLAIGLSVAAPLAAMNFQWPTFAAALSILVLTVLRDRGGATVGWLATLFLAGAVILFLQPIVELIWLALTFRMAGAIGVLIAITCLLCLPAVSGLRQPNAWWAPLVLTTAAGASLGLGLLGARPNADRPAPSTLVYAYEHGSGDAIWATSRGEEDRPGTMWAGSAAAASFDGLRDLSAFGYVGGDVPVADAPVFDAAPPETYVTRDTVVSGARVVDLRVRSRLGAEALQFHLAEGVVLLSVNDVMLEDAGSVRIADHWGEPEGFVKLGLRMPAEAPIGVHIVEHLLRPDELVGEGRFDRPGRLAPNVNWMSDRAMLRFSVAALADPQHAIVSVPAPPPGLFDVPAASDTTGMVEPVADSVAPADTRSPGDSTAVGDTTTVVDTVETIHTVETIDTVGAIDTAAVVDTTGVVYPVAVADTSGAERVAPDARTVPDQPGAR